MAAGICLLPLDDDEHSLIDIESGLSVCALLRQQPFQCSQKKFNIRNNNKSSQAAENRIFKEGETDLCAGAETDNPDAKFGEWQKNSRRIGDLDR